MSDLNTKARLYLDLMTSNNGGPQPCDFCGVGFARVVHFTTRKGKSRFFYGCSNSTATDKCPGSDPWTRVEVPTELQVVPGPVVKAKNLKGAKTKAGGTKRSKAVSVSEA